MKIKKSRELINLCVTAAVLIFSLIAMTSLCVSFSWFANSTTVTAGGFYVSATDNEITATLACYPVTNVQNGSTYTYDTANPNTVLGEYNPMSGDHPALVLVLTVNDTFSEEEDAIFRVHRNASSEYTEESVNFFSNAARFTLAEPSPSVSDTVIKGTDSIALIDENGAVYEGIFNLTLNGSNPTFYFVIEYNEDFLSRFSAKFDGDAVAVNQVVNYYHDIYFTLD